MYSSDSKLPRVAFVVGVPLLILLGLFTQITPVAQAQSGKVCFTLPDQATHTLSGVVNSYFPGLTATTGITQITIGPGRGANVDIANGDLLLIMQMQEATITSTNNISYGSGLGTGNGYANPNNVGKYEFVVARGSISFTSGGTLTVTGKGTNNGLLNTYTNVDAATTSGQRRFQVIRVPAYMSITLTSMVTAASWDGSTGGVVALEALNNLNFNGQTINVGGLGFRGGGGRQLNGGSGTYTDTVTLSTNATNGSKGEGIAGTPRYMTYTGALLTVTYPVGVDGYPNGSYARGAPGNAGGGGTDGDPPANDENSGGGGGSNGGAGGRGGNSWSSNRAAGGFGGAAFAQRNPGRVVLGGGGGAGTTNNGTGTPANGLASSGAPGGGIVIVRTRMVTGTGTIIADGGNTLNVLQDSTGGGGAGGSVVVLANSSLSGSLTISAKGGSAGNAWPNQGPGNPPPGNRHGPGGGGGGGVVFLSSAATVTVTGGLSGTTTTARDNYGAIVGANGVYSNTMTSADIPGADPGFNCFSPTAVEIRNIHAAAANENSAAALLTLVTIASIFASAVWLRRRRTA